MKIILLLGRPQGGGTEAHASWLLGELNKVRPLKTDAYGGNDY